MSVKAVPFNDVLDIDAIYNPESQANAGKPPNQHQKLKCRFVQILINYYWFDIPPQTHWINSDCFSSVVVKVSTQYHANTIRSKTAPWHDIYYFIVPRVTRQKSAEKGKKQETETY